MIKMESVHLYYPLMSLKSHSFQIAMYNKLGGILGKKNNSNGVQYVHALRDITLEIKRGQRLGIIGHNGAGKTTLLRVLAGVYPPSSGKVFVRGKVTAMTDFTLGMDPNVSGLQNIVLRLIFMGYSHKTARGAVEDIVEFSELGDFIHLPVRTYSTGMFMRLAFAISTHFIPEILLLDEVIGAGDESFKSKVLKRIEELLGGAKIVILSSHDLGAVEKYCNSALVMDHGKITFSGPPFDAINYYKERSR